MFLTSAWSQNYEIGHCKTNLIFSVVIKLGIFLIISLLASSV